MHRSRARIAVLLLIGLALTTLLPRAGADDAKPAATAKATDPVLEVVLDTLLPSTEEARLREAVGGVDRATAALPGCIGSEVARLTGPAPRLLRATVWTSVADAEAASLASDGSTEQAALLAAVDQGRRTVTHFRRLREHVYANAPAGHLEVTVFRTRVGTTRDANLARFDAAEPDFEKAEGLLAHALSIAPDGRWAHLVRWRSAADFAATGAAPMKTAGVGGWIRSLDYQRFTVMRGDRFAR